MMSCGLSSDWRGVESLTITARAFRLRLRQSVCGIVSRAMPPQHRSAGLSAMPACVKPEPAVDIVPLMFKRQLDAHQPVLRSTGRWRTCIVFITTVTWFV
jgi:hypothetical protein